MLVFVVLTPFVMVVVFVKALFSRPKPIRYNDEIGRIEDEIESERVKMFGGRAMHPSFSERWKVSYLYAVEKSIAAAAKLDPNLNNSLCGLSQPR
jgi:hypothetical protein